MAINCGSVVFICILFTFWMLLIALVVRNMCSELPGYCRHYDRSSTIAVVTTQTVKQIDAGYCGKDASMCFQAGLQLQYAQEDHNATFCSMTLIEHEASKSNVDYLLTEYPIGTRHVVFLISSHIGACYFPSDYYEKLQSMTEEFVNMFFLMVFLPCAAIGLLFGPLLCNGCCARRRPSSQPATVPAATAGAVAEEDDLEQGGAATEEEIEMSSLLP